MATEVDELLDMLFEMIDEAKNVPLASDKCMVERDKALDLIDEIRGQFPMELAEAKKLRSARDEYIASAKREGELILKQADDVIDTVDLVARENVDRSLPLYLLDATGRFFEQSFAQAILIGLGILLLLYIFATVRYNRIKRRRMMRERRYRQRP